MPVEDHEVHPSTVAAAGHLYGCWGVRDGTLKQYLAPDRIYQVDGAGWKATARWIKNTMSRECRYDMSLKDPACTGCPNRGSGEAYAAGVRSAASVK